MAHTTPIAQFRCETETGLWILYYANLKRREGWLPYHTKPSKDIDVLIRVIDGDKAGVFYG